MDSKKEAKCEQRARVGPGRVQKGGRGFKKDPFWMQRGGQEGRREQGRASRVGAAQGLGEVPKICWRPWRSCIQEKGDNVEFLAFLTKKGHF